MPGWYKKTKPMLYTFVIGMGAFNVIIPHFVLLELHQRITQIIFVHKSSLFYMNKANLELKLCCQLLLLFRLSKTQTFCTYNQSQCKAWLRRIVIG